jgi:hypothetical protein
MTASKFLDVGLKIADELRRPMPCSMILQCLKRQSLAVKDQITRFDGVLRSHGNPDTQRHLA